MYTLNKSTLKSVAGSNGMEPGVKYLVDMVSGFFNADANANAGGCAYTAPNAGIQQLTSDIATGLTQGKGSCYAGNLNLLSSMTGKSSDYLTSLIEKHSDNAVNYM